MPRGKRRTPRTPTTETSPQNAPSNRGRSTETMTAPIEEGMNLWTRYARETGESVTEFLHRFGAEQQKSYETWSANLSEALRPKIGRPEVQEARSRFEEWNRQAEAIGTRIREAFETSLAPQRKLLELWAKPFLPADASVSERNQEVMGLVQKLWSGLTLDLTRRLLDTMQSQPGVDEFIQAQDAATKQFTENFQKLTRIYFTSPAFVTAFGKTLDSSLDLQKTLKDSDEFFRRVTGLPTRREISELNLAVHDLSEQVARLNSRRP